MEFVKHQAAGVGLHVVAHALKAVLNHLGMLVGSTVLRRIAGSTPFTALAFALLQQTWLTWRLRRGRIDGRRYGLGTANNVGSTLGALLGAALGGAVLSIIPVIGTIVGVFLGSFVGSLVLGLAFQGALALAWDKDAPLPFVA